MRLWESKHYSFDADGMASEFSRMTRGYVDKGDIDLPIAQSLNG